MVIFWKWFRAKIVAVVSHRIERYDNPFKSFAFLITNHFEYFSNQKNICGWICCVALEIHTTDTDKNVPVYSKWKTSKSWFESSFMDGFENVMWKQLFLFHKMLAYIQLELDTKQNHWKYLLEIEKIH